jgi:hypothetical protein
MISACHAGGPGPIPGECSFPFFCWLTWLFELSRFGVTSHSSCSLLLLAIILPAATTVVALLCLVCLYHQQTILCCHVQCLLVCRLKVLRSDVQQFLLRTVPSFSLTTHHSPHSHHYGSTTTVLLPPRQPVLTGVCTTIVFVSWAWSVCSSHSFRACGRAAGNSTALDRLGSQQAASAGDIGCWPLDRKPHSRLSRRVWKLQPWTQTHIVCMVLPT